MRRFCYVVFVFVLFHTFKLKAQLCTGTKGEAIFTETFGAGPNPGPQLPAGTTSYWYTAGWPTDGAYTISNLSNPTPNSNPHWVTAPDHTGDKNGYMFVVNAAEAPGEFSKTTVSGLCDNTTYVFSAWIANANDTATIKFCTDNGETYRYPNVLFKVVNPATAQVNSVSTGNIIPAKGRLNWQQFGFTFSTGAGQTTVDLIMVNDANGGCGNDLVIDDISFRACGPSTSVAAHPSKSYYCDGDTLVLDATIGTGYKTPQFQWQISTDAGVTWNDIPGATNEDLEFTPVTPSHTGVYRLIVAEKGNINQTKCRVITDTIGIRIIEGPVVTASALPDSVCAGGNSVLTANGTDNYIWENGNTTDTIHVWQKVPTTYTVKGIDKKTGCSNKASVTVYIKEFPDPPAIAEPDDFCLGYSATITAISPPGIYNWYDQATGGTPLYTGDTFVTPPLMNNTTYYVEVATSTYCISDKRTLVTVTMSIIDALFTANPLIGYSPLKVDFTNKSTGADSYLWNLDNNVTDTNFNTSYTYSHSEQGEHSYEVMLIAENKLGCKDTATLTIIVDPLSELIIPNVFTPNGDGINDLFKLKSKSLKLINAKIYDRWGLQLYEWNTPHGGWDGRTAAGSEVSQGTYYYIIQAIGYDDKEYKLQGAFTLFR